MEKEEEAEDAPSESVAAMLVHIDMVAGARDGSSELWGASFARGAQIQIVGLRWVLTLKIRDFKF